MLQQEEKARIFYNEELVGYVNVLRSWASRLVELCIVLAHEHLDGWLGGWVLIRCKLIQSLFHPRRVGAHNLAIHDRVKRLIAKETHGWCSFANVYLLRRSLVWNGAIKGSFLHPWLR